MVTQDQLYAELKGDVQALAGPLFDMTEQLLGKRARFLPHGAILTADGKVTLTMAAPPDGKDKTSAIEVLPALHEALRGTCQDPNVIAVAVCEDVTITPAGKKSTTAIKVLVEHRRGLTVALYLPYDRNFRGKLALGEIFLRGASPEVAPWPTAP